MKFGFVEIIHVFSWVRRMKTESSWRDDVHLQIQSGDIVIWVTSQEKQVNFGVGSTYNICHPGSLLKYVCSKLKKESLREEVAQQHIQ